MNDVVMSPMSDRGKQIIRYSNSIRICIRSTFFFKTNNIRMRDPMNDVMMNLMTGRGERIIRYLNII